MTARSAQSLAGGRVVPKEGQTSVQVVKYPGEFQLEAGGHLPELEIAYTTRGRLSPGKDNAVWVFHALTANADPEDWWPELVGPGKVLNPEQHFIVCANVLGSCYGTTGPASIDPCTGQAYGPDFPLVTIKDMVKAHRQLQATLGIEQIELGIGGSLGGQQLIEWAASCPTLFRNVCLVATSARHSAWGIAFNTAQRMALEADPSFRDKTAQAGTKGLQAARATAMLSYRNQGAYCMSQTDSDERLDEFRASGYQRHQGQKLSNRFNAHAYWALTKAMDSHHVGRGRASTRAALEAIQSHALVIGINSDLLFTKEDLIFLSDHMPQSRLRWIDSLYGHDGFLIEGETIGGHLAEFISSFDGGISPGRLPPPLDL